MKKLTFIIFIFLWALYSITYSQTLRFAQAIYGSDYDPDPGSRSNFINEFNSRTPYTAQFVGFKRLYELDSSITILWITGHNLFTFSNLEREGIRSYLMNGGIIWADDCSNDWNSPWSNCFKDQMNTTLGVNYSQIPNSHIIFQSFYNLNGTLPTQWDTTPLHGWFYNGAFRVILSNEDYLCGLNNEGNQTTYENSAKMAININVYALLYAPTPTPTPSPTPSPSPTPPPLPTISTLGIIIFILVFSILILIIY